METKYDEFVSWLMERFSPKENRFNQYSIDAAKLNFTEKDVARFNEVYTRVKELGLNRIIRTASGAIAHGSRARLSNRTAYDVRKTKSAISMTIIIGDMTWSFLVGHMVEGEAKSGRKAFLKFKEMCLSHGIDLDSMSISNGKEIKETIEKPMISMSDKVKSKIVRTNVHHLDYHSSYPSGLIITHPEFTEVINEIYSKRKGKDGQIYKDILNFSIGYMQSIGGCNAKWAYLSRDAIKNNNDRIKSLSAKLVESGRTIIGYNTDGIWYQGEIYHDEDEGTSLTQWSNDYVNCKFRAKSNGAYEFIDGDGRYHAVVRGETKLDRTKPREEWEWGDIWQDEATIIKFYFDDEKGIIISEE